MKPLMILPPLVFAALAAMFFFGMNREGADELPSSREGGPMPPLTVSAFPGAEGFTLNSLADGEVKLVNFWASWCGPCRAEHGALMALEAEGVPIYGVNYKDEPDNARAFLDELGDPFAGVMADATGRTGLDWGLYGVPETFVVDGDGVIIRRIAGPIVGTVEEKILRPALAEAVQ